MILAENPACNPSCRACHYKDLSYPDQLLRKQRWARAQLGRWESVLGEIFPAPDDERLGYREKSWLRSVATEGRVSFGMFRAVQGETRWEKEFISWDTCPLHSDAIRRTTERLGRALAEQAPGFASESLFGVWFGTPHLVLIANAHRAEEMRKLDWRSILEPPIRAAWFHQTNQVGKSVFGEGPILPLSGGPGVKIGPTDSPIRAFRQIARTLLDRARSEAVASLLEESPALLLDLYSGTGEIARRLPPGVGWIGIESSKEGTAYAGTLRPDAARIHRAYLGLIEHRLRDASVLSLIPERYGLYINPPRPGLGEAGREVVLELLRARPPTSIAYLSCSASSLARDLRAFEEAGFKVESLQPYDFFPQTEHFETLALIRAP